MFHVGDKVVHPFHGAGTVIGIEEKNVQEEFHRYYVIELVNYSRILLIPVINAREIGLRQAIKRSLIPHVLDVLSAWPDTLSADHKRRQARVVEKLKTGDIIQVAEVIRNLAWRDYAQKLTVRDTHLFKQAQEFMVSELALTEGIEPDEARGQIQTALQEGRSAYLMEEHPK